MPKDRDPSEGISARLVSFCADSADPPGINDYDSFAAGYTAANENGFVHAYYERPAMLALAGDVAGGRVLDAGERSGRLETTACRQDWATKPFGTLVQAMPSSRHDGQRACTRGQRHQIRRVIDTNLRGSINVIRAPLPHLRAQGRGRILQVSTADGQAIYPNYSYYHASKWGIEGFCGTAAKEIDPLGIGLTSSNQARRQPDSIAPLIPRHLCRNTAAPRPRSLSGATWVCVAVADH